MDSLATKKPARKRLGELLVETGIIKPEELPKGLEYAQKATEADLQSVFYAKELIEEQGLSVQTALRALSLSKQRHITLDQALRNIGWQPRSEGRPAPSNGGESPFDRNDGGEALSLRDTFHNYQPVIDDSTPAELNASQAAQTSPAGGPDPAPGAGTNANLDIEQYVLVPSYASEVLPPEVANLVDSADNFFLMQAYDKAEAYYGQSLSTLKALGGPPNLNAAYIMLKLGRVCFLAGKYSPAENLFLKALQIRESYLGKDHIAAAECLDALADLYDEQSQFIEAERYYLTALGIKEKVLSVNNSDLTNSLKKLVLIAKRQGKRPEQKLSGELLVDAGILDPDKVEEGLAKAREQSMPIGRALVSLNYLNDADLKSVLQAQLLLKDGVVPAHIAVRALRRSSEMQIPLEQSLNDIGILLEDNSSQEGIQLLKLADELMQAESQLPPDDPQLAALCIQLGDLNLDLDKLVEAESLYHRGYEIVAKQFGHDNLDTAESLMRLADLYYRQERFEDAQQAYQQVLNIRRGCLGDEDLDVANTIVALAAVHYVQGNVTEASAMYQQALEVKERLLGPEHPDVLDALQGRANCFFAANQFAEAEWLYQRSIEIQEKVLGPTHPQIALLVETLGDLYFNQGEIDKAQSQYARGASLYHEAPNPEHLAFSALLEKMAYCLTEQNNFDQAERIYRQVIHTREQTGTAQAADMSSILERYADVVDRLGRREEAANLRDIASRIAINNA